MMLRPKIVEQSEDGMVMHFPFWASEAGLRKIAQYVERDAAVAGKRVRVTVGHRVVRLERLEGKEA